MVFKVYSEKGRIRFRRVRFQHRTQCVFLPSPSSGQRTQWVPLSLLFVCQSELTEFSPNSPSLPQNSVRLSEFSSLKQYSRNSIPPVSFLSTSYLKIVVSNYLFRVLSQGTSCFLMLQWYIKVPCWAEHQAFLLTVPGCLCVRVCVDCCARHSHLLHKVRRQFFGTFWRISANFSAKVETSFGNFLQNFCKVSTTCLELLEVQFALRGGWSLCAAECAVVLSLCSFFALWKSPQNPRTWYRVHTNGVMQQHATLRRVLRRFFKVRAFLEGFLEGVGTGVVRGVLGRERFIEGA